MLDIHSKVVLKKHLRDDHFEYDFAKDEFDLDNLEQERITLFGTICPSPITTIHRTRTKQLFISYSERIFTHLIKDISLTDELQLYIKQEKRWIFQLSSIFSIINQITDLPQSIDIDYFAEDDHYLVIYTIEVNNFEDRRKIRSKIIKMLRKEIPTINFVDFLVNVVVIGE